MKSYGCDSFCSSFSSDSSMDFSELALASNAEGIPHLLSCEFPTVSTIALPPQSPVAPRKGGKYPDNTPTTEESVHMISSATLNTVPDLSTTNLSSLLISVQDIDLDEEESDDEIMDAKPTSTTSSTTFQQTKPKALFDNKENIAPNVPFHNMSSVAEGSNQVGQRKPPRKRNAAVVPVSSDMVPHKRPGSKIGLPTQNESKRLHRSKHHRRAGCDSLPDLSALKLTSVEVYSNGLKKKSASQQDTKASFSTHPQTHDPMRRPTLSRHRSMTAAIGFR